MEGGSLGPTPARFPLPKLAAAVVLLVVVGVPLGLGVAKSSAEGERQRNAEARALCTPVPPAVSAAITAGLSHLEGRTATGWGAVRSTDGPLAGAWFVSVELLRPTAPKDSVGDIATWLVPADAAGGPALGGFRSVERNARTLSAWPAADPGVHADADGGIESRFCAMDVSRDPNRS